MPQTTSLTTYKQIKANGTTAHHRDMILDALRRLKGSGTFLEISGMCNLDYHQVEKRCAELVKSGKIKDSGVRSNVSPSKRKCIVWCVVEDRKETVVIELKMGSSQIVMNF